jgi:hypothetical protein
MTARPAHNGWVAAMRDLHLTVDAVQRNCHVADARHARDAALCTYLLAMREQFRWEHELPLTAAPPRTALGRWMTEREALWDALEASAFAPVPAGGDHHDPFDAAAINRTLVPEGLVYGAGLGRLGRPHFFLGQLERTESRDGLTVLVSGCEYARDIAPLPGALQGETVYVRRDALRRLLWDRIGLWESRRYSGPLASALDAFGWTGDRTAAFERIVEAALEQVILHEVGERMATKTLGRAWEDMLAALRGPRAETLARAVRDNLADCLSTLPALVDRAASGPIDLYAAMFDGLRRELFPRLVAAHAAADLAALRATAEAGAGHWVRVGRLVLDTFGGAADGEAALERLLGGPRTAFSL